MAMNNIHFCRVGGHAWVAALSRALRAAEHTSTTNNVSDNSRISYIGFIGVLGIDFNCPP